MKRAYFFLSLALALTVCWTSAALAVVPQKSKAGKAVRTSADRNRAYGNLDHQGGPDAYGYRYVDNQGDSATFNWIELRGDANATWLDFSSQADDDVLPAPLGFAFPFYGGMYASANVSTNGNLQFLSTDTYYGNDCLPSSEILGPMICVFWDDLHLDHGGYLPGGAVTVGYRSFGDYAVIEWDSVGYVDDEDGGSYKFEAILWADGRIKLQYHTLAWGAISQSQTIGIQAGTAGPALQYVCEAAGHQPVSALAVLFIPGPTGTITGYVLDTGSQPIYQAIVRIEELGAIAYTDASGNFSFPMVAPGNYTLVASHTSYQSMTLPGIVVTENQTTTVTFTLPWAGSYTYTSADVPKEIQDNGTVTSVLEIDTAMLIGDLDVELNIIHTYDSDLRITLVSPDGIEVQLVDQRGTDGENFTGTVFDDEGTTAIADGSAPFTGRYRPEQPLSTLDGADVAGTWTLRIEDLATQDVGTLTGWQLHVSAQLAADEPVLPRTASFALLGSYPNPFNSATEIHYEVAQAGWVRLALYNILGQEIRHWQQRVDAGVHHVVWDGTEASGLAAASGLYLLRLESGKQSSMGKLFLMR